MVYESKKCSHKGSDPSEMMRQNCGENKHCLRSFITSMREIWEICETQDTLAHIKFWSFSTKERNCSLPQLMNEMTLLQQPLDIILIMFIILIVVYVFLFLSMYSYCSSMYSYRCLCILIVVHVFLDAATLTEVFPCFFLGCKTNARV